MLLSHSQILLLNSQGYISLATVDQGRNWWLFALHRQLELVVLGIQSLKWSDISGSIIGGVGGVMPIFCPVQSGIPLGRVFDACQTNRVAYVFQELVKIFLERHHQFGFLTGDTVRPPSGDALERLWKGEDSLIRSMLINSTEPQIGKPLLSMITNKGPWMRLPILTSSLFSDKRWICAERVWDTPNDALGSQIMIVTRIMENQSLYVNTTRNNGTPRISVGNFTIDPQEVRNGSATKNKTQDVPTLVRLPRPALLNQLVLLQARSRLILWVPLLRNMPQSLVLISVDGKNPWILDSGLQIT
ncbi:Beta-galactosidase [Cucumis melo var. makuwa]|uniref:Beta-galactosidase n=1 Tax=Cucumis melo var. makuwa TaxID=1194695 RepID=A0A5A7VBU5_CUCMM|nr:Beta-galactosidase [Cucumis melo var. makuwa]